MKKSLSIPVCLFSCHIFVWSRTKLSVAKFVYFFTIFCIELCANVLGVLAFNKRTHFKWKTIEIHLFVCSLAGWLLLLWFFFLRLYPYRFAVVYFDSDSMLYIVHGSRYTHIAWELHRAYFTVEEFVYLTFVIRNSIETRSQLAGIQLTY